MLWPRTIPLTLLKLFQIYTGVTENSMSVRNTSLWFYGQWVLTSIHVTSMNCKDILPPPSHLQKANQELCEGKWKPQSIRKPSGNHGARTLMPGLGPVAIIQHSSYSNGIQPKNRSQNRHNILNTSSSALLLLYNKPDRLQGILPSAPVRRENLLFLLCKINDFVSW